MYRCIHDVLNAIMKPAFIDSLIKLPNASTPLSETISADSRFYPFFKYALGAIDGSHIPAFPPEEIKARYRDRQENITQNILAACTFDMRFCYVLSGWEGSAADSQIFDYAHCSTFAMPDGYYYLADAGFLSCRVLLVPYRGVRYYLREWNAVPGLEYIFHLGLITSN